MKTTWWFSKRISLTGGAHFVEKMDGIQLNLEGFKFRLGVAIPTTYDFQGMRKDWEAFYAFGNCGLWPN